MRSKRAKLAWQLKLAHKESQLFTNDEAKQDISYRPLNLLLTSSLNKHTTQDQMNDSKPAQAELDTNKLSAKDEKLELDSEPIANSSALPQNLEILTYRGLAKDKAAQLTSYQSRQQLPNSDDITDNSEVKHELFMQLRHEGAATFNFSKALADKFWQNSKAKQAQTKLKSKLKTLSPYQKLRAFGQNIAKEAKSELANWRSNWHKSQIDTSIYNQQLNETNAIKRLLSRHFSLKQSSIFVLALIIICNSFYILHGWALNNKQAEHQFKQALTQTRGIQLAGQLTQTNAELEKINLNLAYPSFNDDYLNLKIKTKVDELIQPYIKAAESLNVSRQSRYKALLVVNYDACILAKRLLSVVFTLNYYEQGARQSKLTDWQYCSFYYDLPNHQVLSLQELLPNLDANLQELADNFNNLYRYEKKEELGLPSNIQAMQNLLFTNDKLVLIVEPKLCQANLIKQNTNPKELIKLGGSREVFSNYLNLSYKEAGKFFNASSPKKLPLNYDVWSLYYNNHDKEKLLPYDSNEKTANLLSYKFLALTFDHLPETDTELDNLCNVLAKNEAHATFFISKAEAYTSSNLAKLKKLQKLGHEIALLITNNDFTEKDVDNLDELCSSYKQDLSAKLGSEIKFIRLNKLNVNEALINIPIISNNNYIQATYPKESISQILEHNPEPGDIVELTPNQASIEALSDSLELLRDRQIRYANINECATLYKEELLPGDVYTSLKQN